jgi:hypothetical protein
LRELVSTRKICGLKSNSHLPFWDMQNDNSKSTASSDYCLYKESHTYAVYLMNGGTTSLDLPGASNVYDVRWYDPRNGGDLQTGSVSSVTGGGIRALGDALIDTDKDWAILVTLGDSDGDGMSDAWELNYFGNTTVSAGGPTDVWDNDGSSDLHEYLAGANPTSPVSQRLAFSDIDRRNENQIDVKWLSIDGKSYTVMSALDLSGPRTSQISGVGATEPVNDLTVQATGVARFWRIILE